MKYDLDELLKESCNEELTPSHALNQMTLQKIKDGSKSRSSVKYGIKRFAQWAVLCVSICLLVTVSVPAFTAVVTYIKEVVGKDKKEVEEKTTAPVRDYSEGITEWVIEDGVLIISGTGNMQYKKQEKWYKKKSEVKEIIIEEGVTDINFNAFCDFTELESVYIPDSVVGIESNAFDKCVKLKDIRMSKNIKYIESCAFKGCVSLTEIELPEGLEELGAYAFEDCTSLAEIIIPDTVKVIRRGAFNNCSNLQYVKMPENLEELGGDIFEGTKWVENEEINVQNLVINGDALISGKDAVGYVVIPDYIKVVSQAAFENSQVERIIIPDNITKIENSMFNKCSKLKGVVFEGSIDIIEWYAFSECDSLESIRLPEGVVKICDGAFAGCDNLTSIYIPESLEEVGDSIFDDCNNLRIIYGKSGSLAEKLAKYGDYEFVAE